MLSFDSKHYVPALKWRKGEYRALSELTPHHKTTMTPLIEIPPIPWDYENDLPGKTIDEHLSQTVSQISGNWGTYPAFLDVEDVQNETMQNGQHPLVYLTINAMTEGLNLVPTTGLDREQPYQSAVSELIHAGVPQISSSQNRVDLQSTT